MRPSETPQPRHISYAVPPQNRIRPAQGRDCDPEWWLKPAFFDSRSSESKDASPAFKPNHAPDADLAISRCRWRWLVGLRTPQITQAASRHS